MGRRVGYLAVYVAFFILLAGWNGWNAYHSPSDCADEDGHGPDPGSRECEASLAGQHETRPIAVREAIVKPLAIGGGLLILWLVLLPVSRLPFFRNG
ncbi:hypothetical protein [Parerythrobacter lacustris]|uniref:DUF2946 domain-containing protein n=1 Tax=Parerythrobacter lacustris TaxID=2969984 RepID=A0ABT1XQQ7_9SPHN|nr:hypothetical protein [Parerythrobacter lacustris]MCR2833266.1 hypothetical protein [Parerythrobacter lacustris]